MGYVGAHRPPRAPFSQHAPYVAVSLLVIGGWTAGVAVAVYSGSPPPWDDARPAEAFGPADAPGRWGEPQWPYPTAADRSASPGRDLPSTDPDPTSIQAQPVADLRADLGAGDGNDLPWFTPLVPSLPPPPDPSPGRPVTTTAPSTTAPWTTGTTSPAPTTARPSGTTTAPPVTTTRPTTTTPAPTSTTITTSTDRPDLTSTTPPPTEQPTTDEPAAEEPDEGPTTGPTSDPGSTTTQEPTTEPATTDPEDTT